MAAAAALMVAAAGLAAPTAVAAEAQSDSAISNNGTLRPVLTQSIPDRIAGENRWDTAARVAAQFGGAHSVIVANGVDAKGGFDALAANYLAGVLGAPILLTSAATLPPETSAAAKAVLSSAAPGSRLQILVMGKEDSVSSTVVTQLDAIAQQVAGDTDRHWVRVAGDSRYDTAVAAATVGGDDVSGAAVRAYSIGSGSPVAKTAFLASGTTNADALAAGPISNALRIPVYLTSGHSLPAAAATALASQGISNLIVLGGADRIPESVIDEAKAAGVSNVIRIAGANRYDTAARLYTFARSTLAGADGTHYGAGANPHVFVANGLTGFPDALTVGPLAAKLGAVLLTTSQTRLESAAQAFLAASAGSVAGVTALGKDATVAETVLEAAKSAAS